MHPTRRVLAVMLLWLCVLPLPVFAQGPQQDPAGQQPGPPTKPEDEQRIRMEKEMAKKANEKRQADLRRDSDELLKLATELQQYVGKSNEHVLSLEVVRKAEQIEKLAHSVKVKMKGD